MADTFDPNTTPNAADLAEAERLRAADEAAKAAATPFTPFAPLHPAPAATPLWENETPETAAAKLRAFEDEHFGKDAQRINGEIERGVGSPYASMKPHQKAHYTALENLVKAEKAMADASVALADAQARHAAAVTATENAVKAIEAADAAEKAEADKVAADKAKTPPKAA